MKDGVFANGGSLLQSWSEEEVFYLLKDMTNYDYHWHLSPHNAQQHGDPLEDQIQALIELQKKTTRDIQELKGSMDMINDTLSELV